MTDIDWDPEVYLSLMLAEVPGFEELEDAVAEVARGSDPPYRQWSPATGRNRWHRFRLV